MKILSSIQTHQADQATLAAQHITSEDLMERAGNALAIKIKSLVDIFTPIKIFCGPGNNGGDGLVVARILFNQGYNIDVYIIESNRYSTDFEININKLKHCSKTLIHQIHTQDNIPTIQPSYTVIDAIFGSGLNRKIEGLTAQVIQHINNTQAQIIAIDTPSGLTDFAIPENNDIVIHANHTITIEIPFVSMLLPENYCYTGDISIAKINLDQDYISKIETPFYLYNQDNAQLVLTKRPKFSHKGNFGHSLIIAGSYGKAGAAILCSKACHRTGSGLVTVHVPKQCVDILQIASPETMVSIDNNDNYFENKPNLEKYSVIGIGPGLDTKSQTIETVFETLTEAKKLSIPVVIDADALNAISINKKILNLLPKNSILTPHIKEFDRIFGESKNNLERIEKIQTNTKLYSIIIILKGAHTIVGMSDGSISFNTTGNPAMATAGSGDVLTGIITALLAQKLTPQKAACYGVYIHGLAGDMAAKEIGNCGITAQDIISYIPKAIEHTQKTTNS